MRNSLQYRMTVSFKVFSRRNVTLKDFSLSMRDCN